VETAALQDASRCSGPRKTPPGLGLRQPSGALTARVKWTTGETWRQPHYARGKSGRGLLQSKTLRDVRGRGKLPPGLGLRQPCSKRVSLFDEPIHQWEGRCPQRPIYFLRHAQTKNPRAGCNSPCAASAPTTRGSSTPKRSGTLGTTSLPARAFIISGFMDCSEAKKKDRTNVRSLISPIWSDRYFFSR
jgi:hypothetical protein